MPVSLTRENIWCAQECCAAQRKETICSSEPALALSEFSHTHTSEPTHGAHLWASCPLPTRLAVELYLYLWAFYVQSLHVAGYPACKPGRAQWCNMRFWERKSCRLFEWINVETLSSPTEDELLLSKHHFYHFE